MGSENGLTAAAHGASPIGSADVVKQEEHEPDFSCQFDRPWFGASYPDSYCVDGYLHDADADGYIPSDQTHPCPRCNTKTYLEYAFEEAGGTELLGWGSGAGMTYVTGDEIWEIAKRWAHQENPSEAEALISALETSLHREAIAETPSSVEGVNNPSDEVPHGK